MLSPTAPIWDNLRAGTIITVSEELDDNVTYDPWAGDWWINVDGQDRGIANFFPFRDGTGDKTGEHSDKQIEKENN